MYAIGIDLGTTNICGIVMDTQTGEVVRSITQSSGGFLPGAASWERLQDPEKILSTAIGILDSLMCPQVCAIGITGQMHGILYTNRSGKAVSPLYTWQDGRGNLPYGDTTYAKSLNSFTGYGNVTDFYNRMNGLVPADAVSYCTVQDYLVMRLCGLTAAQMHITNAASLGCFDLPAGKFICDCPIDPLSGFRIAGTYRSVPVGVAIGDNQASVFSCLADRNSILVNVGTGSQISIVSQRIPEGTQVEVRPYFDDCFLVVGAALCGGRAYAMLKDFFARVLSYTGSIDDEAVYGIMEKMLRSATASLQVDPRFCGTRLDETLQGSIRGITPDHFTPEALTLGMLKGMAEELFEMYGCMQEARAGLIGSGNGLRKNHTFQKVLSQTFCEPLRIPIHTEEAAFGAALYALVASDHCRDAAQAQTLIRFVSPNKP